MTENEDIEDSLLPLDIFDVKSKPEPYFKCVSIQNSPYGYKIKTETGKLVEYCILREKIMYMEVKVKVPANTTKLYVYGRPER